ncbi:ArdC family protein [Burkholderia gladioli]|uniref:ArdC family protein n=1 Tax=Burkholderia gladioli TaxID=28095 RepID=UPI00163FF626|nr:ArdC family protein [Burkholderia gladioli]
MSTEQQTQQASEASTVGFPDATQPLPFAGVEAELQKASRVAESNVDHASQQAQAASTPDEIAAAKARMIEAYDAAKLAAQAYQEVLASRTDYLDGATAFLQEDQGNGERLMNRSSDRMAAAEQRVRLFAERIAASPYLEQAIIRLEQQAERGFEPASDRVERFLDGVRRTANTMERMAVTIRETPSRIMAAVRERAIGVRDAALAVVGDTMSGVRAKVVEAVNVGQAVAATVAEAPQRTLDAVKQGYAQNKFKAEEASAPGIFAEMRAAIIAGAATASQNPDAWQPYNAATGRPFEGAARLRLATAGHDDPRWMTPAQIQAIGGTVRADAEAVRVYYYERGADGKSISLKTYSLVNASQVDGVSPYEPLRSDRPAQRLRETAVANGTEVGGKANGHEVAASIIATVAGNTDTPADAARSAIAREFLKAMHGQRVDGAAIADALRALPSDTRNKDVLDLTNAAARVSLEALGKAPGETAWRVERSVLPKHEIQPLADVPTQVLEAAADVQHDGTAPMRQRVRARGPMR